MVGLVNVHHLDKSPPAVDQMKGGVVFKLAFGRWQHLDTECTQQLR